MFLRNYWYVAAWDHEVGREPFARTILNEPVVLYRKEDGSIVALEDRCAHRHIPLSRGTVVGDAIQCWYHGLTFDCSGTCIRIPGQAEIPAGARVRTYPVVERYRWIWVWIGDPALADPDLIPDFHWNDDPDWGAKGTVYHVKADYQLIIDNLLDLTHLAFVHATTIGNAAIAEAAEVQAIRGEDDVTVVRWVLDQPPPPTYSKMMGGFTGNIDRWQIIHFTPPGFIRLFTGAAKSAASQGAARQKFTSLDAATPEGGIGMRNLDIMTPETETSTHYFWSQTHDFSPHDQAVTDAFYEQIDVAFRQDWELFEVQQKAIERAPNAPSINIRVDQGPLMARNLITRLLRQQQKQVVAAE